MEKPPIFPSKPEETKTSENKAQSEQNTAESEKDKATPSEQNKVQSDKIAKGLTTAFVEQLRAVQQNEEQMNLIRKLMEQAKKQGEKKPLIAQKTTSENKAKEEKEGIKIQKGKEYLDEKGNPIKFDFSILFEEDGHAIALDEHLSGGSFGQVRAAADINDLSKEIVVKVFRKKKEGYNKEKLEKRLKLGADKEGFAERQLERGATVGPYMKSPMSEIQRERRKHNANQTLIGRGLIETQDKVYLVQERVQGVDFADYINYVYDTLNENKKVTPRFYFETLRAAIAVCEEVQRIHNLNIIHRDLKPENMLFDPKTLKARLVDPASNVILDQEKTKSYFRERSEPDKAAKYTGLVYPEKHPEIKGMSGRKELLFYAPNKLRGTPEYIAPEALSLGIYSKASDRYALGVLLNFLFDFTFTSDRKKYPYPMDDPIRKLYKELTETLIPQLQNKDPEKRMDLNTMITALKEQEKTIKSVMDAELKSSSDEKPKFI